MTLTNQPIDLPGLAAVIDYSPLTVGANTLVIDALALMSKAIGSSCDFPKLDASLDLTPTAREMASCVLVVEKSRLLGVFTERDLVRLTVAGINLSHLTIGAAMTSQVITIKQGATDDVMTVLSLMRQHQIRHLPVVDEQDKLVGLVTLESIRRVLQPMHLLKLRRVSEMMKTRVIHAPLTASVLNLAELMQKNCISCVVITEHVMSNQEDNYHCLLPVGIITERDIVQFQVLGLDLAAIEAKTVMSTPLYCISPADSLWTAHLEMQRQCIRRLVVTGQRGELQGILTQISCLQVFDPWEMSNVIKALDEKSEAQTRELRRVNQQLQQEIAAREIRDRQRQRAVAQLAHREQLLRAIFESEPECVKLLAQDNTLLNMNPAGLAMIEADSLNSVLGQSVCPIVVPEYRSAFMALTEKVFQGESGKLEFEIIGLKGTHRWLEIHAVPLRDIDNEIIALLGVTRDISEQQAALRDRKIAEAAREESERTLSTLVSNLPGYVYRVANDPNYTAEFISEGVFSITEYRQEEYLIDRTISCGQEMHPDDSSPVWEIVQAAVTAQQPYECVYRIITKSGIQKWVWERGRGIYDSSGELRFLEGFVTDISEQQAALRERKRAEESLQEKQAQLEDAIAELTRSNLDLEQFAYAASHDLQEPLRKIKSFAQLLVEEYQGKLDDQADRYLNHITDATTRMQAMIDDLLSYSRVGQLELNKQPTDLNAILSQVQADLSIAIAENNAVINATPLPTVLANPGQMSQLIQNLLANSLKFRRQDATPEIQISAVLQQQEWLICVQDNGIGLKPKDAERIFAIFQRLHTRYKYPGNGIGLAICRKIIERHGGRIWVEAQPEQGAIFKFTLPF